jgi:hypothetical protein
LTAVITLGLPEGPGVIDIKEAPRIISGANCLMFNYLRQWRLDNNQPKLIATLVPEPR